MAVRTPLRMTTSLASLMMCLLEKDLHYPAIPGASHRRWLELDQTLVMRRAWAMRLEPVARVTSDTANLRAGHRLPSPGGCKTTWAVEGISARGCWRRRVAR